MIAPQINFLGGVEGNSRSTVIIAGTNNCITSAGNNRIFAKVRVSLF